MFTVCPKCALTLAVSATDLRVGQGYVRCGRCSNVFNALLTLSEEAARPGAASVGAAPARPPPAEPLPPSAPSPAIDSPPPPEESAPELTEHDVTFVVDTAAAAGGSETHEYRDTGTFETIVLEGEAITQTEEMVPEESVDTQIAEIAQQIAAAGDAGGGARVDRTTDAAVAALTPPEPEAEHRLAWGLGAAAMLLVLAGQAVHHWRDDLATSPLLNGPLTQIYAALGVPLTPRWDLGDYEVNQLGAQTEDGTGAAISVRLSVMNRAERAQPVPIVRLTLLDRYGKRLAARDLTPREYLRTLPGSGFLGAGQRVDAQVAVRDPGPEASSFELDVCLPGPGGTLRCANDQSAATASR